MCVRAKNGLKRDDFGKSEVYEKNATIMRRDHGQMRKFPEQKHLVKISTVEKEREIELVCVCVCEIESESKCVCVCVCVREKESKTLDNILVPLNEWVTSSALGGILCSEHLSQRKERAKSAPILFPFEANLL